MLRLQSGSLQSEEASKALGVSHGRVIAMARVHEHLYSSEDLAHINGKEYLAAIIEDLVSVGGSVGKRISYEVELEEIILDGDQAISCGQIIAELISNVEKHAFPNDRSGRVHISLHRRQDNKIELAVTDDGVGMPENFDPHQSDTLGLQLVTGYAMKLGGKFFADGEGHLHTRVVFPEARK